MTPEQEAATEAAAVSATALAYAWERFWQAVRDIEAANREAVAK